MPSVTWLSRSSSRRGSSLTSATVSWPSWRAAGTGINRLSPKQLTVQLNKCRSEILPGPSKLMGWGAPEGTRDQASGELVHDDDLITGALCHKLNKLEWYTPLPSVWTSSKDPMPEWDRNF
jgi:hypothetical protein